MTIGGGSRGRLAWFGWEATRKRPFVAVVPTIGLVARGANPGRMDATRVNVGDEGTRVSPPSAPLEARTVARKPPSIAEGKCNHVLAAGRLSPDSARNVRWKISRGFIEVSSLGIHIFRSFRPRKDAPSLRTIGTSTDTNHGPTPPRQRTAFRCNRDERTKAGAGVGVRASSVKAARCMADRANVEFHLPSSVTFGRAVDDAFTLMNLAFADRRSSPTQ